MKPYDFKAIEQKWHEYWNQEKIYRASEESGKEGYYVLDMFPYPSGAGLHVGHPLGYIASDIYARYKRNLGYEVLHPMGYDAFGLPAEQYAIETGQHPATTTEKNITRYRQQLESLGLSVDWEREFRTCDPAYYKWTQWIFLQLFQSWYDLDKDRARPVSELEDIFDREGNKNINSAGSFNEVFTAEEWKSKSHQEKQEILMHFRLAYRAEAEVNWCPALGTVLANDEVKEGRSERGGHPVYRKNMSQWFLRITAYADRLLYGLDKVDWPNSLVEMQKNWIGKSQGAEIIFEITGNDGQKIQTTTFTTRPDTIFGATYLVLAPEHEAIQKITTGEQSEEVNEYVQQSQQKTQRERLMDAGNYSGVFTGSYAVHPFTGKKMPVWIADYVLAGYGTGAIMAVPAHDERDHGFAKQNNLPIIQVVMPPEDFSGECYDGYEGVMINSDFINDLQPRTAIEKVIEALESQGKGRRKTQYRLRDANFSRQRYWGEPFPIVYDENGTPEPIAERELPVELPEVDSYEPTGTGESPLARNEKWVDYGNGKRRETDTMPASAGSSWYFLRFMDPNNPDKPFDPEKEKYWQQVDLYVGGAEHATGHLMYARFWHKFLMDRGWVSTSEPFQKLINQGKILGRSNFVYKIKDENRFVSKNLKDQYDTTPIHVDVNIVDNDVLDTEAFRKWRKEYADAEFVTENGKYICGWEMEKMSKSKYNVVNPDDVIDQYGTDALRIHEMFLGPVEDAKLWDIKGLDGIDRFLGRFWRLFHTDDRFQLTDDEPTKDELKILHKTIRKVREDLERFSMNTCISTMMECVNDLTKNKCNKRAILEPLIVVISPFAPYMAEELWHQAGKEGTVTKAPFPEYKEEYVKEDQIEYPVSVNGKLRAKLPMPADANKEDIEKEALGMPEIQKWTNDKEVKKVIVVPGKIVNIAVKG